MNEGAEAASSQLHRRTFGNKPTFSDIAVSVVVQAVDGINAVLFFRVTSFEWSSQGEMAVLEEHTRMHWVIGTMGKAVLSAGHRKIERREEGGRPERRAFI